MGMLDTSRLYKMLAREREKLEKTNNGFKQPCNKVSIFIHVPHINHHRADDYLMFVLALYINKRTVRANLVRGGVHL